MLPRYFGLLICLFAFSAFSSPASVEGFTGGFEEGEFIMCEDNECGSSQRCLTDAEFKIAYFYPTSNLFREIYKSAYVNYGLEFTQSLWDRIDIWENVSWLPTSGHSKGLHYKTNLNLFTFSAGLKYSFCYDACNTFHLGLGGVCYSLRIHDKANFPGFHRHRHFQGGGLAVKADYERTLCNSAYWGLFIDYYYLPISGTHGQISDIGGTNFGGRIGYHF